MLRSRMLLFLRIIALVPFVWMSGLNAATGAEVEEAREIKIVASFYPVYIMAKNVARDVLGASVANLTASFSGCPHDYALTTSDMKKLAGARVFVANGAGMESFLERIAEQYPGLKIINTSEGIALITGEGDGAINPHVWVSISDYMAQVTNLGVTMAEIDPIHKELYDRNTADYIAKLEALRLKMQLELAPYKGREIVTFHQAFPYFAREFGLEIAAVIEREPGSQPSAKEMAQTIKLIKDNRITALFSEPQYSSAGAKAIAEETGTEVYVLDPAVSGPDDDDAYLNIMESNLAVLKRALAR
ncbi:MAG: metal ABC transporter substrate-binding protein [Candidatus Omnitrophota bacterium]|nr:metal ABC transporter substrate-binding protein [Candidatus Omnitrophota bacterium]